jgi:SAM-dependent methyltransferase
MQSTRHSPKQYFTSSDDAHLYGVGYSEFMRRSNVRINSAESIANSIFTHFDRHLAGLKILDIGCNDGAMTSLYLTRLLEMSKVTKLQVTLVDPATDALSKATTSIASMGPRLHVLGLNATAEALVGTMKDKYDVICGLWIFYHINPDFITHLFSMIEPKGLLLVTMSSPTHPIKSHKPLTHLSRHGDSQPVQHFLNDAQKAGIFTYERLDIATQIDLNGLWETDSGFTDAGKAFFSVMFNRNAEEFGETDKGELGALIQRILREQAGVVTHDHFLYLVKPVN